MPDEYHIDSIHEVLAKTEFIVFAGAGVVSSTGVPSSWIDLLIELSRVAQIAAKKREDRLIFEGEYKYEDQYPDVAQIIYDKMQVDNRGRLYDDTIKEVLKPTESDWSPHQFIIMNTTKWVVTTNFDYTFEGVYKEMGIQNPNIRSLPSFRCESGFEKETLIYLHGKAEDNVIVLRRDQYESYYPSVSKKNGPKCLESYLEYIYTRYPIIFIGFSFSDKYFRECLKNIYEGLKLQDIDASRKIGYENVIENLPQHFAFMPKRKREAYRNEKEYKNALKQYETIEKDLGRINIKFLSYEKNVDWTRCLNRVRDIRKAKQEVEKEGDKWSGH